MGSNWNKILTMKYIMALLMLGCMSCDISIPNHPHPTRSDITKRMQECKEQGGIWESKVYQTWVSHEFYESYSCVVKFD